MDKFCYKCGSELVPNNKEFDRETGAAVANTCPTKICGHSGCQHSWKPLPGLFNGFALLKCECTLCGEENAFPSW